MHWCEFISIIPYQICCVFVFCVDVAGLLADDLIISLYIIYRYIYHNIYFC